MRSMRPSVYLMVVGFVVAAVAAWFVLSKVATNWEGPAIFGVLGVVAFAIGTVSLAGRRRDGR